MEHFYQELQGWFNCRDLYERVVREASDGAVFVEIGSWKGKSAAFMAVEIIRSRKDIAFYTVDNFKGSLEHQDHDVIVNGTLEAEFFANMSRVAGQGVFIHYKMDSLAAAARFEDRSCDMVYIDASHEYEDVKADILAWLPKVKFGGLLAGDDVVAYDGVRRAVEDALPWFDRDDNTWVFRR
jgi:predicted O-methyltransferase YrrM